ncbi:MAG: HAD family hydrolase [Betaproteobacteria bacterium]|jgi:3-deoxy-D-manno-octulosonate 8-phosphate phosphatase (KDO 8-P phosphatase)
MNKRLIARAHRIRLAIFDVDGVLTDGTVYVSESGEEIKAFNILDGLGLKMLAASGVATALLSGRKSKMVALRAKEIGIAHLLQGVDDKLDAYNRLLRKLDLAEEETSFMGDDLPDLPVLRRCGFAFSVPNAPEIVRNHAHYVTRTAGGRGAAREACEFLMQARGTLESQMRTYLS